MGLQKRRADKAGDKQKNGGTPWYTHWMGGPSLALVRECKIEGADISPRTVYVQGEADTMFSIPAACSHKRKTITGYITTDDNGEYVFRAVMHEPIPDNFEVKPIYGKGSTDAICAKKLTTCGYCGLSWDDGISTGRTPVPAGRCPFEEFHK